MGISKKIRGGIRWTRSRFTSNSGILLYHRVAEPESDRFSLCVPPSNFEEQMEAVAESGGVLSLPELMEFHERGDIPEGSVVVTFDDGYLDNFERALPILEKYQVPATIFVATGNLGGEFWWDVLERAIRERSVHPEKLRLKASGIRLDVEFAGRSTFGILDDLYPFFRGLDAKGLREQLDFLVGTLGVEARAAGLRRAVTEDELKELGKHPLITIGAHTVSHTQLSLKSAEAQKAEIGESVQTLEAILGQKVRYFSYPFGLWGRDYTEETIAVAKACGLECAIAADLDVVTRESNRFALPRIWGHNWNGNQFRRAVKRWVSMGKSASIRNRETPKALGV